MTNTTENDTATRLRRALAHEQASVRLQSALAAGTSPNPAFLEPLVERCAVEPDFFVRDMLTWALTRQEREPVVAALHAELDSSVPQARSQALHTLSKIADARTWPAITPDVLRDDDAEVARAAWRAAVAVVPSGQEEELAEAFGTQLGRGDIETHRSLSRVLVALGDASVPVLERAARAAGPARAHALATITLMDDPDAGFEGALAEARRAVALRAAPVVPE